MTDKKTDWSRWQGWRGQITYWRGFVAYYVYLVLPVQNMPYWSWVWLLPYAGDYAYWDEAIEIMTSETTG